MESSSEYGKDSAQILVRPSEVPMYLRESEFFSSLDFEDDGQFSITANTMKATVDVETAQDIWDLLNTVRFWGLDVSTVPSLQDLGAIYDRVVREGHMACLMLLDQLPKLRITQTGYKNEVPDWSCKLTEVAAGCGQLECLKFLHSRGCSVQNSFAPSAANDQIACLQYALSREDMCVSSFVNACVAAEEGRHITCLNLLSEKARCDKRLGVDAACQGSLEGLICYRKYGGKWHFFICHGAALNGHIKCLMYACDNLCPLMPETDVFGFRVEYMERFGLRSEPGELVGKTVRRGHWNCARFLILNDCPVTPEFNQVLLEKNEDIINFVRTLSANVLAYELQTRDCILSPELLRIAASKGDVRSMRCLRKYECCWSREVCITAARFNKLESLKYAHENGCSWDCRVIQLARKHDYSDIVEYAAANGCPEKWRIEETLVIGNPCEWVKELKEKLRSWCF